MIKSPLIGKSEIYPYVFLVTLFLYFLDYMEKKVRQIFQAEAEAVMKIPVTDGYAKAVDLIYEHVHRRKGKLVTSGMGKAGQIANDIATTFSSTGTPAVFLHPSEAQHGDLGILQENDCLLVITNSGKTREIIELISLKENLFPDIPLIVITGNPLSQLAEIADVLILTGNPKEVCTLGLTPTTSTTVMTVIGDALVVLMMEKIGFTADEYAKRHHGGYLGIRSREISKK
jgi:arabinose-5-phosphate isomerase